MAAHAHVAGLSVFALTDHDTTAGLDEAAKAAQRLALSFLNGVEISSMYGHHSIHILGLGIDPTAAPLVAVLERLREGRARRADAMIAKLQAKGLPIDEAAVMEITGGSAPGRIHLARVLHANGAVSTVQEAFDRWLKAGRSGFVAIPKVSCERAVEAIHAAGGLAFIAHPGLGAHTRKLLPHLLALPFDGIEVYHSRHNAALAVEFLALARERGLLVTGGSDCHGGANGPRLMGQTTLPYSEYERIDAALQTRRA